MEKEEIRLQKGIFKKELEVLSLVECKYSAICLHEIYGAVIEFSKYLTTYLVFFELSIYFVWLMW